MVARDWKPPGIAGTLFPASHGLPTIPTIKVLLMSRQWRNNYHPANPSIPMNHSPRGKISHSNIQGAGLKVRGATGFEILGFEEGTCSREEFPSVAV